MKFIPTFLRTRKRVWRFAAACVVLLIALLYFSNRHITSSASERLYDDVAMVPYNEVGLLLGTSKYLSEGGENQFFANRIDAAAELFRAGKINYIILSGDNRALNYNEPMQMKRELLKHNIPDSALYLDYAGFRTLDSILRCRDIFGQNSFTIISQRFHNERALFIAQFHKIDAIGFNARDVDAYNAFRTNVREWFARVKTLIDLYILDEEPKYLGERIVIP